MSSEPVETDGMVSGRWWPWKLEIEGNGAQIYSTDSSNYENGRSTLLDFESFCGVF
jgi:hypothetical protein